MMDKENYVGAFNTLATFMKWLNKVQPNWKGRSIRTYSTPFGVVEVWCYPKLEQAYKDEQDN